MRIKNIIEYFVWLTAAIIGLYFFAICLFGLSFGFVNINNELESLLIILTCILGVLGYLGIWGLFFFQMKKYLKLNFFLLVSGLISFLLFWLWTGCNGTELLFLLFSDKNQFPSNLIFLWFISVSIYYTVVLGRKIKW